MDRAGVGVRVGCEEKIDDNEPSAFDEATRWVWPPTSHLPLRAIRRTRLRFPSPGLRNRAKFSKVMTLAKEGKIRRATTS